MSYNPAAGGTPADGSITTAKLGGDITTAGKALLDDADAAVAADFSLLPETQLFGSQDGSGHPLVLANQEGFIIRSGPAWPATMTWHFSVNVVWSEVPAY